MMARFSTLNQVYVEFCKNKVTFMNFTNPETTTIDHECFIQGKLLPGGYMIADIAKWHQMQRELLKFMIFFFLPYNFFLFF